MIPNENGKNGLREKGLEHLLRESRRTETPIPLRTVGEGMGDALGTLFKPRFQGLQRAALPAVPVKLGLLSSRRAFRSAPHTALRSPSGVAPLSWAAMQLRGPHLGLRRPALSRHSSDGWKSSPAPGG